MSDPIDSPKVVAFVNEIRDGKGEFGLLVRLVGELQQRWDEPRRKGSLGLQHHECVVTIRSRMADLSRASDQEMRDAAMTVGRIGKALEEQKANAETAQQFGPILALLQKRIDHARQKVQACKTVVRNLNGLADEIERTLAPSSTETPPPPPSRAAKGGAKTRQRKQRA